MFPVAPFLACSLTQEFLSLNRCIVLLKRGVTVHVSSAACFCFGQPRVPEVPLCPVLLDCIPSGGRAYHDVLIDSAAEHLVCFRALVIRSCTAGNILIYVC